VSARPEASFQITRRLFFVGLGVVYVAAFASLWSQAEGLLGGRGIAPAAELLERADQAFGLAARWWLPSVLWLDASDAALQVVCGGGVLCGLLLAAGVAPRALAALAYALYLSLVSVGDVFLGYQWDALLLETGLLAVVFAPGGRGGAASFRRAVGRVAHGLLLWLLFRLMFTSGVVKLASGDPTWWGLTALDYHFHTQPLPTWTSWYADRLPHAVHAAFVLATFAIELVLPFLVFGPALARRIAFGGFALLQLSIAATGSYGFFNLLALVLCLPLLDDALLGRVWPWRRPTFGSETPPADAGEDHAGVRVLRRAGLGLFATFIVVVSVLQLVVRFGGRPPLAAGAIGSVLRATAPLHAANAYGLFAIMTTHRDEIRLEGSRDGRDWKTYVFPYKPDDLDRAPAFAGLHMPRLDWQMWFAALGRCESNPWLHALMSRLLEGSKPVSGLFERDPFAAGAPPRYLRTTVGRYTFAPGDAADTATTTGSGRLEVGRWWQRVERGPYCPTVELDGDVLRVAPSLP
jgi:hypothetical protein